MGPPKYKYSPLNPVLEEFRILELHPGISTEKIRCSLQACSSTSHPPYECLSYTWGNATITDNIELGGVAFAVTTNLLSALQHLRLPVQPQKLWVDAICIDQSSIPERESQVRLIRKIY
jgi:hypothetical protein